jgi:uroporphyrinogen decarboxylase
MNPRERYLETLLFGSPDRIPFEPGGPRESTLKRWHSEGLPENRNWFDCLCDTIGISPDPWQLTHTELEINFRMNPTFEEKVLEHENGHYIIQDWMGNIIEISDEFDYTYIRSPKDFVTRKWHRFPVESPEDFDAMKVRYDPDDPARYPHDFDDRIKKMQQRDYVVSITIPGPFWQLREWCGFEPLCILFMDNPVFISEMVSFWIEFVSKTMARALQSGIVDRIWITEDMAYKGKSMISPAMAREFLMPAWSRWAHEARRAGVLLIDEDSDGMLDELIPVWIESGINVCDPIEVAAGNDINEYRRLYGTTMAYRMGIDKRCIARGGTDIEKELTRIEPVVKSGGYIPGCDHGVPHDISWQNFVSYAKRLARITGWL